MAKLAFASFLLWAITVAAAAFFYINGVTRTGLDGRREVILSESERQAVQADMRKLLQTVADITAALARPDAPAVARLAGAVGMQAAALESPALLAKLPIDFKTAGMNMHASFDQLSAAAKGGASQARLTTMLSEQLQACAACHEVYRLAR